MSDSHSLPERLVQLGEEFAARYRRGERPTLTEYTDKHPDLAEGIRDLFPTLVAMEELAAGDQPAPAGPGAAAGPMPKRLGEYRLLREVARGGMGIVYEAAQENLGRHVALKLLPSSGAPDGHRLERFRREARAAANLHHTNIVPVFGVGEQDGVHYYAMQFIHGQGLDSVLHELRRCHGQPEAGPVPAGRRSPCLSAGIAARLVNGSFSGPDGVPAPGDETGSTKSGPDDPTPAPGSSSDLGARSDGRYYRSVAQVGVQVAEALAYAHGQGVLHRDIKPSNLLLDTQGTVWVTDFGLAKVEGADELTSPGDVVGTLRYMAPERFQGQGDARSDLYSLGLTLYELATLRPAFTAPERAQLVDRVLHEEPARPRRLDPGLPRDLETIILKATAKEPAGRYPTAAALADDLRRFLGDQPIRARPPPWHERARRWCRRNPALARMSGVIVLLLLTLVVGSLASAWRMKQVAERATRAEGDATNRLFDTLVTRAEAGRTSKRPGQRFGGLEAVREAAEIARVQGRPEAELIRLRNEASACLALPDIRLEKDWEGNLPGTSGIGFDARCERYAWSFQDEGIRVRRLEDHAELIRLPVPRSDRVSRWVELHFSPEGRYLAAWFRSWSARRFLQVWDLQMGQVQNPRILLDEVATRPEFTSDGRSLLVGLPDGAVTRIDLETGNEVRRLAPGWPPDRLALHPDGRLLAVASTARSGVQIRDLDTGRVVQELPHPAGVQAVAWQPEGLLLATGCDDHHIRLWDSLSGQPRGTLEGHRWEVHDLAFDPSGHWLLSFGWEMALCAWDVGFKRQVLKLEDVRVLGFSAQGGLRLAGLTGRRVRVWSFHPSDVHHVLHGHTTPIDGCDPSPDGRWLATSDRGGGDLRLWDLTGRRQVAHLPGLGVSLWGPRGEWLLTMASDRLCRWPVRPLGIDGAEGIRIGPPRAPNFGFPLGKVWVGVAWSGPERRRLFVTDMEQGLVHFFEIGETSHEKWRARMPQVINAAASADGRWVAAGSFEGGSGVRIWEAETGRLEKELPIGDAGVKFSSDSRWLYTTTARLSPRGAELCAWRVGAWEPEYRLALIRTTSAPCGVSDAPDGTAVAVPYSQETVRLLHAESLAEIVTLTAPEPGLILSSNFSHDGSLLLVNAGPHQHLWDLRRLRHELKELGLDWDLPDYPSVPPRDPRPLRVVVDKGA